MKPLGIYLHFPFCQSKCAYCDFPSFAGEMELRGAYTEALAREIRERAGQTGPLTPDTVYLGGGTPSLMEPGQIKAVMGALRECYDVAPQAEISCEANPGTLTPAFLEALREAGVNRLSLGAQSAHADELILLGRIHGWEQVKESLKMARNAGFDNINVDLMSALPGGTWGKLRATLDAAIALSPTHVSCYSLILEESTPLFERRDALSFPSDEAERELYWKAVEYLEDDGYIQYEISNFARPGFACRHNLGCWMREEYLGFGSSAAGFHRGVRRRNAPSLRGWLAGEPPEEETVTPRDAMFESVMLGLRLTDGLPLAAFEQAHGIPLEAAFPLPLKQNVLQGMMEVVSGRLRLTRRGLDVMDRVLLDFLD